LRLDPYTRLRCRLKIWAQPCALGLKYILSKGVDQLGSIAEVTGIKVGHAQDQDGLTGFTVVLCEKGATASVEVVGGAPGTRETDLLRPSFTVSKVQAIFLSGGSAFGLNAASGVVRYLEEKGVGFDAGIAKVPIVSGAVIFDLGIGDPTSRPTIQMAYEACVKAKKRSWPSGNIGVGTGATVGKLFGPRYSMKAGLGNSCLKTKSGFAVGCLIVVNALGDVYDPRTGKIIAGAFDLEKKRFLAKSLEREKDCLGAISVSQKGPGFLGTNTTIGVIATDAPLTKEECNRVAKMAIGGLAQTIRPSFTPFDGDAIFVLSTSDIADKRINAGYLRSSLVLEIGICAQTAVVLSVLDAVVSASSAGGRLSWKEVKEFGYNFG